jgi:hypothetical protein
MKKILEFLKSNFIIAKWTFWYFLVVWAVLWYIFRFDMFSRAYWWKFFHAHLHGFVGFVFGALVYSIIPIYIATTSVVYRTKKPVITIPVIDKISEYIKSKFAKPEPEPVAEPEETPVPENKPDFEYPADMPREMHALFKRTKERMALLGKTGPATIYQPKQSDATPDEPENKSFPIPTDFDIDDSSNEETDDNIPTFKEINFDEPAKPAEPDNTMIKYLHDNNIDFDFYNDFIITNKYLIYVHNDPDFWIMDDDNWFAAGKQIKSPVATMLEMIKDEPITPVIYFESTNILDFDGTVETLRNHGITVITNPTELD